MKTQLTPKEEKELIDYRDDWLKNALRTDPVNHEDAQDILTKMYASIGEAAPRVVILPSPMSCVLVIALLRLEPESIISSALESAVSKTRQATLENATRVLMHSFRKVISKMGVMPLEQAWLDVHGLAMQWANDIRPGTDILAFVGARGVINVETVMAAVLEQLRAASSSLMPEKFAALSTKLDVELRAHIRSAWSSVLGWGQWHSWWVAFYDFARRVGAVYSQDLEERLEFVAKSMKVLGTYLFPFRDICFVADRPSVINLQGEFPQARLHCGDGPAMAFRDSYSLWCWRGIPTTREVIVMSGFDAAAIDREVSAVTGSRAEGLEGTDVRRFDRPLPPVRARAEKTAMMPLNVPLRRLMAIPPGTKLQPVSKALMIEKLRPLEAFSSITVALHNEVRDRVIRCSYEGLED
jgi:hypothetical protein